MPCRLIPLSLLLCLLSLPALAAPVLWDQQSQQAELSEIDQAFIESRLAQLNLPGCRANPLAALPRHEYRYLSVPRPTGELRIYIRPDVLRTDQLLLIELAQEQVTEYTLCNFTPLLPVLAIMATAPLPADTQRDTLPEQILAEHSALSSHDPSYLWLRNDDLDSGNSYMDFAVSLKHPLLNNAEPVNALNSAISRSLEALAPGDNRFYSQFYLAFSGRFSQYIGNRNSAPVVARRFNPALFYRIWSSPENYLDFEFGHESNGQRINSAEALLRAEQDYLADGEPAAYARDSLSRGWDYTAVRWQRSWNQRLLTRLGFRYFLSQGPLQDDAEEYNVWEGDGPTLKPRHDYAGMTLGLQYNFNRSRCLFGALPICFRKLSLQQETGYSRPFEHNTTTLELTSDLAGLPIQLWAKSGYNSNLVDYYRYTTSWGLGIELLSY